MSSLSVGTAFAELAVRGEGTFNQALAAARGRVIDTGRAGDTLGARFKDAFTRAGAAASNFVAQVRQVGERAQIAFAAGTAAITGFVAAASPDALNTLTGSFKILAAEIGRAFVPYVIRAAYAVQEAARRFRSLSGDQKESIAQWLLWGTAAAGALVIGGRLITVFTALAGVVKLAGAAFVAMGGPASAVLVSLTVLAAGLAARVKYLTDLAEKAAKDVEKPEVTQGQYEASPTRKRFQEMQAGGASREDIGKALFAEQQAGLKRESELAAKAQDIFRTDTMFGGRAQAAADLTEQARQNEILRRTRAEFVQGQPQSPFTRPPGAAAPGGGLPGGDLISKMLMASAARPAQNLELGAARSSVQLASMNTDDLQRALLDVQKESLDVAKDQAAKLGRIADRPFLGP
jgi:hypothetical protein